MANIDKFTPQKGQVVIAQGHEGTFKVLDVSADGQSADIHGQRSTMASPCSRGTIWT
jgi:hypothetical protein